MTETLHWSPAARTHSLGRAGSEGLAPALDRCSSGAAGLCRWSRGGGGEGHGCGRGGCASEAVLRRPAGNRRWDCVNRPCSHKSACHAPIIAQGQLSRRHAAADQCAAGCARGDGRGAGGTAARSLQAAPARCGDRSRWGSLCWMCVSSMQMHAALDD